MVLHVEGLVKRFGDLVALDGLTLSVDAGEILALLGPNGAGKTTAIRIICGLLRPDSGRVEVRGAIGVAPQQAVLWPALTCTEQLELIGSLYGLTPAAARARSVGLLEVLELAERRHTLARHLSGGMQRRLNLALALVHDPDLVILDEPEAGLDPRSRVQVREFIRSLARRKTVLLCTHDMDEADRLADRVAILDRGRLLALDSPAELKRRAVQQRQITLEDVFLDLTGRRLAP